METLEKPVNPTVSDTTDLHVHEIDLAKYFDDPSQPIRLTSSLDSIPAIPGVVQAIIYRHGPDGNTAEYPDLKWISFRATSTDWTLDEGRFMVEPDSLFVLECGQRMINSRPCELQTGGASGDYWADVTTGEFVAYVIPEGFRVDSLDAFNWVMRKMLAVESDIMAVEQSADVIAAKAIVKNAAAMRDRLYKRYASLENFFGPDLGEFARQQLEGKKERTFYSPFGSVGLRKKAGGLKILDKDVALSVAKMEYPDAVDARAYLTRLLETAEAFLRTGKLAPW